jgi:hypothetical protein
MASRCALKPAARARPSASAALASASPHCHGAVCLGLAGQPHVGRLAARLRLAGPGLVALDVDGDLRRREVRLHVGGALGLLHLDPGDLRPPLLLVRDPLWLAISRRVRTPTRSAGRITAWM